jgi:hypothetical protein
MGFLRSFVREREFVCADPTLEEAPWRHVIPAH